MKGLVLLPTQSSGAGQIDARPFLRGIRVIDLTRVIAGPLSTQLLADFGAEVIKVEKPSGGDDSRAYSRSKLGGVDVSAVFANLNMGKKSICLDLREESDRQVLLSLVDNADVFIHNYRPGVAERMGLDAKALTDRNTRLIYCAISGFGESGPLQFRPGNDIAAQAYGGLMSLLGDGDGPPTRCPVSIADINTGYSAAIGILGALVGRGATGRGAVIGTSLLESMIGMMGHYLTDYLLTGETIGRLGSGNRFGQPNQAFRTSDGYIVLAAVNQEMWCRAAAALGGENLAEDPRFQTQRDRVVHQDALVEAIEARTCRRATSEWVDRMDSARVTCAPIRNISEVVADEQTSALGMITQADYCGVSVPVVAAQLRVNGKRSARGSVPGLGEHTTEVLSDVPPPSPSTSL
jgi:crotonobetainyl-CoA:carnitine CoA-transferase CaiB-like acyl-CoA transferase